MSPETRSLIAHLRVVMRSPALQLRDRQHIANAIDQLTDQEPGAFAWALDILVAATRITTNLHDQQRRPTWREIADNYDEQELAR